MGSTKKNDAQSGLVNQIKELGDTIIDEGGDQDVESDEDPDIVVELDEETKREMDKCLSQAFLTGDEDAFARVLEMIFVQDDCYIPVDYQVGININELMLFSLSLCFTLLMY